MTSKMSNVIATLQANSKVRGKRVMNRTFTVKSDGDLNVKLSPQAVKCLEIICSLEQEEISEQGLVDLFVDDCGLVTKQDPYRVFQYYRKSLIDAGWITME